MVATDEDGNGIFILDDVTVSATTGSGSIVLGLDGSIVGKTSEVPASLAHSVRGARPNHKVDGSRTTVATVPPDPTPPTLVSATATTLTVEWTHPGDGGSPLVRNYVHYRVEGVPAWTNWYPGETPVTRAVITNLEANTAYDVRVHVTNAIGNSEWAVSATAFSTLANTPATGEPAISGTATVGQVLTATTGTIADADGLPSDFTYQWVRVDADGTSNPADIPGANAATYTLTGADAGKKIKVRVSFTDDLDSDESRTSAAYPASSTVMGTDTLPPVLVSATVSGTRLTLYYNEALDEASEPPASAFTLAGTTATVMTVLVSGSQVTLTLTAAPAATDVVTLTYAVPAANPLQDVAGNDAPAFSGTTVTRVTLRLVGGDAAHEGRLEILHNGEWGTICDDYWTDVEADVACRALGYPDGSVEGGGRFDRAHFGRGSGSILLDDVNCVGNETSLLACDYRGKPTVSSDNNNCSHSEDVGVRCQLAARARVAQAPQVSPSGSDGWTSGETLQLTLTFSEAVTVDTSDGTPSLEVVLGANTERQAAYASGSGSRELVFTYEMVAADGTHTAVRVTANSLQTNGGRIYATSSERDAALAHEAASLEATVPPPPADALTARFAAWPPSHSGPGSRFSFEVHFSAEPEGLSYRSMAGPLFEVTNGAVTGARRLTAGNNSGWQVDVKPSRHADVTVALRATTDCEASHAVCTAANARLLQGVSATVSPALPALSVFDAEVQEGPGAQLDFEVTLSPAAGVRVAVYYETADGTARVGRYPGGGIPHWVRRDCEAGRHNSNNGDYLAASGLLLFEAGETVKTVSVAVCDDAHDEGSETMSLRLTGLPLAGGILVSSYIADGSATGTITNDDPMPGAWIARFGRTVGSQVLEAVSERLDGSPAASHFNLGGVSLGGNLSLDAAAPLTPQDWLAEQLAAGPDARRPEERTLTGRDLLLGSSFHLVSQAEEGNGAALSAWGRVSTGGFRAEADEVTLDGDVVTGLLGFDAEWERLLAGLLVAHSEGDGAYRLRDSGDRGRIESSLTGLYPYARLRLGGGVSLWALAGAGSGDLRLLRPNEVIDTGLGLRLGALGVKGALLARGGFDVAVKSDVLWVQTDSDAVAGGVAAAATQVSRLRLILEAGRTVVLASGALLAPTAQVGLRHDGGDAETGTGVEVGAGIRYSAGLLTIEGQVRTLLAHEAGGYEEWGASGSIRLSPNASGLGPSLALLPSWGAAGSTVARLWSHPDASALGAGNPLAAPPGRLDAELGWGLPALRGRGILTPYARVALAEGDNQSWHLGTRLALAESLNLSLEGSRRRFTGRDTAHDLTLRASLPW